MEKNNFSGNTPLQRNNNRRQQQSEEDNSNNNNAMFTGLQDFK